MVPFCSQIQPIYRRSRAEIYPRPSAEIFVPTCRGRRPDVPSARQRRAARLPPCGAVDASRRRRFSSQRWRSRAAILCVWQADSPQPGGDIPAPVSENFRPGDGEAVPPYFVYGNRIRRNRAEIYPCPSAEIFVPAMAKPCRHTLCMASGFDAAGVEITPTGVTSTWRRALIPSPSPFSTQAAAPCAPAS